MKAITLVIIVLFSFSFVQAQENTIPTKKQLDVKKIQGSKTDFYKELISAHNLQITIADNATATVTHTKAEFYNKLITKNNLKPTTALAYTDTKGNSNIYTVNTEVAINLVP